jgi:hypothetical protein
MNVAEYAAFRRSEVERKASAAVRALDALADEIATVHADVEASRRWQGEPSALALRPADRRRAGIGRSPERRPRRTAARAVADT